MKFNRDGTLYQLETVLEAIDSRCAKDDFPNLSDLLGSDWGWNDSPRFGAESYRQFAIERAKQIYGRK